MREKEIENPVPMSSVVLISFPLQIWTPKENAGQSWLILLIPCQVGSLITDLGVQDKHLGPHVECQDDTG